ncbi:hypothetical protein ACQPZF_29250 [Actinosynnema sp. CS-041913]|uniref:hypothetical protein n=1 Tax=Actinosynnema sp. CS-041913 TaxID=3239917 RepID=UPI003D9172E7
MRSAGLVRVGGTSVRLRSDAGGEQVVPAGHVEVDTGLPSGAPPGARPRHDYDPQTTTLAERQRAKAVELGVGLRTIELKRARYAAQGLWGLVDQRADSRGSTHATACDPATGSE